jgi:ParB-like chromosome segregation protein Spo0J
MSQENSFHCKYDELVSAEELVAHPKNPNEHSRGQIEILSKIIQKQGWRSNVVVSKNTGFIISGHGRVQAALMMEDKRVPVNYQEFENEAEEWSHLIADNRLSELAEISTPKLAELFAELDQSGADMDLTGFDEVDIEKILLNSDLGSDEETENDIETQAIDDGMRMVQLFMTTEEHSDFEILVSKISKSFDTKNTTDSVRKALELACETIVDEENL